MPRGVLPVASLQPLSPASPISAGSQAHGGLHDLGITNTVHQARLVRWLPSSTQPPALASLATIRSGSNVGGQVDPYAPQGRHSARTQHTYTYTQGNKTMGCKLLLIFHHHSQIYSSSLFSFLFVLTFVCVCVCVRY